MDADSIIALLGLQLPKVYAVNMATEWLQEELKHRDMWDGIAPFSFVLPFVVALILSSFGESGCEDVIGSGMIYGAAAIALHHVHALAKPQPP